MEKHLESKVPYIKYLTKSLIKALLLKRLEF